MEAFLAKLTQILGFAESKNPTERRKSRSQLLDVYADDECVEAINKHTAKNFDSSASWNEIMLVVHRSALMEAEKPGRSSVNAAQIAQSSISALMYKTVNLATNTANISLNCDNLMALCFQVWRNEVYKPYHETYMHILIRFVLVNEMYWTKISLEQWQEILSLSVKMYPQSSDIFKNTLLDAMRLVVLNGCSQTHLMQDVKNMLPFLEKLFQGVGRAKEEMLKALYKLTYTVCLQIGTESRLALCEFSERCLPPLICLEGCPEMYKMLLVFVQIHHPGGVMISDLDADYSCDSKKWNSIMRGIYGSIFRNLKTEKLEPDLLKIACEVCRQILKDPSYLVEASCSRANTEDQLTPRKVCRLTMPVERPIDILLIKKDIRSNWPFIQIVTVLLRKYPETLKSSDYLEFLKIVASFAEKSLENETIFDSLCELLVVLVENEKQHYYEAEHVKDVEICWKNTWEMVLRASSMNKNQLSCHKLLQWMIKHKNLSFSDAFQLYINKSITWSSSSVETLQNLCSYASIPSDESFHSGGSEFSNPKSSTRDSLLKWTLDIPSSIFSKEIPVVSLGNLLTDLVIKSSYNQGFYRSRNEKNSTDPRFIASAFENSLENELLDDWEEKASNDIEKCNLALIFKLDLFENTEVSPKIDIKETIATHEIAGDIFETLISNLSVSLAKPQVRKKEISMWITKATVVAKIISNLTEKNVNLRDEQISRLVDIFGEAFTNILDIFMTKNLLTSCTSEEEEEPIEALERLYCSQYHRKVEKIIIDLTPSDFIEYLNNSILQKYLEKCKSRDSRDRDLSAVEKIVTYYSCAPIGDQMTLTQKSIFENFIQIMENGECIAKNSRCIRTALRFLTAFSFSNQQSRNDDFFEMSIKFIRQLLRLGKEDDRIVRTVLKILPRLMKTSKSINSEDSLARILVRIKNMIVGENHGPLVNADFFKCLSEVISINPLLKWQLSQVSDSTQPVIQNLISCIGNPFHVVRFEAAKAFFTVFSSPELDVHWKLRFLEKIVSAIANLLGNNNPTIDELATRRTIALNILAAIIRSNDSRQLHSRALFAIIQLSVEKNIKATTIKKTLLLSSGTKKNRDNWPRKLVEMNLRKLLSRFLEVDNSLEKFPWVLTDCSSFEDFLKRYIETLVIIKLQRLEFEEIQILCNNLEISFTQTVVDCFPSILALLTSMSVRNSTNDPEERRAARYANEIHEKLRQNNGLFSKVVKFSGLIKTKKIMPGIVVEFVKRLHDQRNFDAIFKTNISLPYCENEPNLDVETFEKCLWSFENDLSIKKDSLIEHLVVEQPIVLWEILMTLAGNIYDVKSTDYELLAFYQWAYFYTLIIDKISESYFDLMSFYIVRDISHSLIGFIKEETAISELSCSYFERFLSFALPKRSNAIEEMLSFIVSSLIPIIKGGKVKGAISLLRYLIVQQEEILADAIEKLDSFPNEKVFEEIKQVHNRLKYGDNRSFSLEEEIEHFLNATTNKTLNCSLEGLSHLNDQLSTRKYELGELYRNLEELRGFAEDCALSTLHRLMHKLVQLTLSCDTEISLKAAKCLGELGPADLTTIILQTEKEYVKDCDTKLNQVANFNVHVINHLSEYLVDNDIELKKSSADALQYIFDWSSTLLSEKDYLHEKMKLLYGIENSTLYFSVYPFLNRTVCDDDDDIIMPISIQDNNFDKLIKSNDLWIPKKYPTYSEWIIEISSRILECFTFFYTNNLKPICKRSVEFSEMIFPRLVNLLITARSSLVDKLCTCINRFFGHLFETTRQSKDPISPDVSVNPQKNSTGNEDVSRSHECVRSMLKVVNFMRIQSLHSNTELSFDYFLIANAADYISAYFTSLLYAELWGQNFVETSGLLRNEVPGSWISAIDSICEANPSSGKLLQHIVREAYLHIGDPDSIYGCVHSDTIDSSTFRTQHYTHLRKWDKVMLEQDMELNYSATATRRDMLNALQKSGRQYLLGLVINSDDGGSENNDDFRYEAAWRLADWSSLESNRVINTIQDNPQIPDDSKNHNYHVSHYRALEYLRNGNDVGLTDSIIKARTGIVNSLRKTILECTQTMYPILSKLQMLREIEQFSIATRKSDVNRLIDEWNIQDFVNTHDLQYLEPILAQRLAMYQIQKSRGNDEGIMDLAIINTHLKIAQVAEKQGYLSMASRALDTLSEKIDLPDTALNNLVYRKATLAWKEEEHDISRCFISDLIKKPSLDAKLRAEALRICGNWMAETKCETPQAIIDEYYEKSICTSTEIENSSSNGMKSLTDAQADLGQFADAQYQQITRFMESEQYECLEESVYGEEDENMIPCGLINEAEAYRQQSDHDASELKDIKRKKDAYLVLAAKNYLQTLQNGNDHDVLVFRLVSLWLDNTLHPDLNEILEENLSRVASYKFVTLLCQVAPHMSYFSDVFNDKINNLMERCAIEHPHHTLPVLFALKNTYKDQEYKPTVGGRKNSSMLAESRITQSNALISKLWQSEIRPIVKEISLLSNALVMLAYYQVPADEAKKCVLKIPRTQAITKIRDFNHTIVPTMTLAVSPSGNYDNIVGIREYEANFKLPGGVNAPKNIVCIGSDGIGRRQLVKGQDDLRQDAVMQQVCTVMNSMLKASRETKRRRLHIRTYKIVPLSRRSGVLEWCENTLPMSHVLTDTGGKKGLHSKYYPNDWKTDKCRAKLKAVQNASRQEQLQTFLECCKNVHPAFHHFFLEKYPSAEMWFERRLAYVRSVATTSMVGYMLGLGDRHFSNILIDQTTAEVIHIDFGIAFAQGKVLPIPETVPFRLTRDMEVAMGICGVEGVMKRCCEETMAVLRDRRKILITVLQVLLHDPLFSWAITPVKTNDLYVTNSQFGRGNRVNQENKKTNKIARKALMVIEEKLQGTTDGRNLSIPGQVERLIQQARDPANLCSLFCGWQAYL